MESIKLPEKLSDWNLDILNKLIQLRDIESEKFDFKGIDLKGIYKDICAMANTRGGFLVLGIDENKTDPAILVAFNKVGFDIGKEDFVNRDIRNNIVKIEPTPQVNIATIQDGNKFYAVLEIENNTFNKPFFIKDQGQCYIRIGSTSTPANRLTVLDLFTNSVQITHNLQNLRSSIILAKEALSITIDHASIISPSAQIKIAPIDISLIRNSVLACMPFLVENDLLGKFTRNSSQYGMTTVLQTLELMNACINAYNMSSDVNAKLELQSIMCQSNYVLFNDIRQAYPFFDRVISVIDAFLSKNSVS